LHPRPAAYKAAAIATMLRRQVKQEHNKPFINLARHPLELECSPDTYFIYNSSTPDHMETIPLSHIQQLRHQGDTYRKVETDQGPIVVLFGSRKVQAYAIEKEPGVIEVYGRRGKSFEQIGTFQKNVPNGTYQVMDTHGNAIKAIVTANGNQFVRWRESLTLDDLMTQSWDGTQVKAFEAYQKPVKVHPMQALIDYHNGR